MNWLKHLFLRRRRHRELSEEIQAHLDEKIDELVAGGMSREEATYTARREFGNVGLTEEDGREVWRWPLLEDFFADIRHGMRTLRHNPVFAAVGLLTIAIGIGANLGLQRCKQRSAGAAQLSEGRRTGSAAPDRAGRGRACGFREWPVALALDVLHLRGTKPHVSIVGRVGHRHPERHRSRRA